jgi:ribosomal 50S subunit-recycling heat shock protein
VRLDSFLSDVRLIKRRTQAKKACENQIVWVDGKIAKPSREVKVGQRILVDFTSRTIEIEVLDIPKRNVKKEEAHKFFRLLRDERKKYELL